MISVSDDHHKTKERRFSKLDKNLLFVVLFTATCAPFATLAGMGPESPFVSNGFLSILLSILAMTFFHFDELKLDNGLKILFIFSVVGSVTTLIMSFIISDKFGSLHGQSAMTASAPSICWLFFNFATALYFSWSYRRSSAHLLDAIFDCLVIFVLIISALEILFGETLSGTIGRWIVLYDSNMINGRICGVASEPSAMAGVLGLFCLPYCYARFKHGGGKRYFIYFAALVIVAFFTKSTTVFITLVFVFMGIFVKEFGGVLRRNSGYLALAISLTGLIIILTVTPALISGHSPSSSSFSGVISKVLSRATSTNDQSGAYRNSTIVNDWKILAEYPFCGVGDGNQGFFYAQNLPNWILLSGSTETLDALAGAKGVLDGGAFIGSLISGYGIIGITFFMGWLVFTLKKANSNKRGMGHYYDMYFIALCGAIPVLWMNLSFKGAPVTAFAIFCLPYINAFSNSSEPHSNNPLVKGGK